MTDEIRFEDGAGYERYMGKWSQLVGDAFLDWLSPAQGLRWLDVGCGNGAFTEMIVDRCAPAAVDGIDPSEAQLAFARMRPAGRLAEFHRGDAMALPFADDRFEVAVMPLVIFFVPVPARGVAEMARVVRPGGLVTAYGWDLLGGGFPYDAAQQELRRFGITVPEPPSPGASRMEDLRALWTGAGLEDIELRAITVERTFEGFEDYWETIQRAPSMGVQLRAMAADTRGEFKAVMHDRMTPGATGTITCAARAHAVKGRVPRGRVHADAP